MNGIRFYLEHESKQDKRKKIGNGNVIAVIVGNRKYDGDYEAVGAVYNYADSPVAGCSASVGYLREQCTRISEQRAREIHAQLFRYLDQSGGLA